MKFHSTNNNIINGKSANYNIIINDKWFSVSGTEAACIAYNHALQFAHLADATVYLVDAETLEILATNAEE